MYTFLFEVIWHALFCMNIKFNLLYWGTSSFFLPQAYVQQLESSRLKLTQLEQELQRARQQVRLGPSSLHALCIQLFIQVCITYNVAFPCRVSSYQAQEIKAIQWLEMVIILFFWSKFLVNFSSSSDCTTTLIWSGLLKQQNA